MTVFILKIIAITSMLIDHMGFVFPAHFPYWFRIIGRVAFPIFVYLIAEGCRHTRSMPKYLLRLFIFALISEIPFDLAGGRQNMAFFSSLNATNVRYILLGFTYATNVFYTLFLGALSIYIYQLLCKWNKTFALPLMILPLMGTVILAEYLGTDYSGFGVIFIFSIYLFEAKPLRIIAMTYFCLRMFEPNFAMYPSLFAIPNLNFYTIARLIAYITPVVLVAIYNGKRGPSLKWFFYVFYPAHLLILGLLAIKLR